MLASQRLVKFGKKYDWFGLLNLGVNPSIWLIKKTSEKG
jgi:hypothetical protein